jgi:hypothetical protein
MRAVCLLDRQIAREENELCRQKRATRLAEFGCGEAGLSSDCSRGRYLRSGYNEGFRRTPRNDGRLVAHGGAPS